MEGPQIKAKSVMFSHAPELVELGAAQHSIHAAQTISIQTAQGVSLTARSLIHLPLIHPPPGVPPDTYFVLLEARAHPLLCLFMGAARSTRFHVTPCIAF